MKIEGCEGRAVFAAGERSPERAPYKADEVIDWQRSAARHAPIARFLAFEGGSHSFEHAPEALQDFDAAGPR